MVFCGVMQKECSSEIEKNLTAFYANFRRKLCKTCNKKSATAKRSRFIIRIAKNFGLDRGDGNFPHLV